jgi:hypothetical protein
MPAVPLAMRGPPVPLVARTHEELREVLLGEVEGPGYETNRVPARPLDMSAFEVPDGAYRESEALGELFVCEPGVPPQPDELRRETPDGLAVGG